MGDPDHAGSELHTRQGRGGPHLHLRTGRLLGIEQVLTRKSMAGDVCGSDECVDLTTAIRLHTINWALASLEERLKGSLEVGKVADRVPLAEDLCHV
jgi:predicted amidohydrolase YtcJ